ncbi:MAG TPA: hypothetical protein VMN78_08610 [Longimicrobiales bacterium]|nr:hypothetical protein [Longimicrobiales bacterium]
MAYRDEIARLEAMHAANPAGRVFAHLAEACRKRGELERAREVLHEGLQRHPHYASAHVVLGRVLLDLIDPKGADEAFHRVLELDPHNMVALRARGDIAHAAGSKQDALRYYRELNSIDPSDEQTALRIAELEAGTPAPSAADEDLPFVIESNRPAVDEGGPDVDAAGLDIEPTASDAERAAPASDETGTTSDEAEAAPAIEAAAAAMDEAAAGAEATESWLDEIAPPFEPDRPEELEAAADYGEAALPTPETTAPPEEIGAPLAGEPPAREPLAGEPLAGEPLAGREAEGDALEEPWSAPGSGRTGDTDLGLGGRLEPTDLAGSPDSLGAEPAQHGLADGEPGIGSREALFDALQSAEPAARGAREPEEADAAEAGAADALAGLGAFEPAGETEPDAVVDLSGLGGHFTLPPAEDAPVEKPAEDLGLPGIDEIAGDATPIPTAPADEPAPAPATPPVTQSASPVAGGHGEADFDSLWQNYDDGVGADLPEGGTEVITETIGDLYAQQGLHERAAEVYVKLLETRTGDAGLEAKLEAARAAAAGAEAAAGGGATAGVGATAEPEPEADSFALPRLADVDAFSAPPWEEAASAEPDLASPDDLGLETIGGGDVHSPAAGSGGSEDLERVESAWTGGAGAAADVESPFGWAEPESPTEQSTIGDYLDHLLASTPPPAEAPARPVPSAEAPARPVQPPEPPARPAPPAEPQAAATASSADDIDALFSESAARPGFEWDPFAEASPAAPPPAPEAPATPSPASQAPATPGSPAPPAAASRPSEPADDFEWDPFAELSATPPAAQKPAAPAPEPARPPEPEPQAGAEGEAGDDDEDIDMFRTWLQSLKR